MSTKIMGINMTMHHFIFGVTEDKVTFNPDNYPGIKITDQRPLLYYFSKMIQKGSVPNCIILEFVLGVEVVQQG